MGYTDKLIEDYLTEVANINENKLNEAPDSYGLTTDDEYDQELKDRIARVTADITQRKEETHKEREKYLTYDKQLDEARRAFNQAYKTDTEQLYNDIINGLILVDYTDIDFSNNFIEYCNYYHDSEGKPYISIQPTDKNLCKFWVYLKPCSIWTPVITSKTVPTDVKARADVILATINSISDNFRTIINELYTKVEHLNAVAMKKFSGLFTNPSKLTAIIDTSNPGHWAWGCEYMRFSCKGKVYEYEEYDSGAYSSSHNRTIRKFVELDPLTLKPIRRIDPASAGLTVTKGPYVKATGQINLTKLK